jgi:prolyl-tRNA editing enzyme YbaK/EbsC (Cys-tRNA(Pro) deacylase)
MPHQTYDTAAIPGDSSRDAGAPDHVAAALDHVPHHAFHIDADRADTEAFIDAHRWPLDQAVNTIVVTGKRADRVVNAMCVVLASTKIDVNKAVRNALDVRKVSFAPRETAVTATGMEFGSITPFGAPLTWPILVDAGVITAGLVAVGGGRRDLKVVVDARSLADLPGALVVEGLAIPR